MWVFWYVIGLILTVSTGYYILRLCLRTSKAYFYRFEYIIYSFLVWVICIPFILFIFGWIGVPLSLTWTLILILWINIFLIIVNNILKIRINFVSLDIKQQWIDYPLWIKIWFAVFSLWIIMKILFGFLDIIKVPTYQDDAFGNRNYRAKVFYERESLVLDKQDKDYLWQGYKQYPLTPSLYKTYLMKFTGQRNEWLVNLPSFLFYICALVILFFTILRRTKKLSWAGLWLFLLSWIPLYYIHWTNPYFDVFQWVYFFAALSIVYAFLQEDISISLPVLFVWMLGYTKSEWLIIFMVSLFVTYILRYLIRHKWTVSKKDFRTFLRFLGSAVIINLPFIIFKLTHGLWFGNGEANVTQTAIWLHTEIFYPLYTALFKWWCYNLIFFFFVITLVYVLFKKRLNKASSLWFILWFGISFWAIIFVYATTFTYQYVIDQTGINRSMMQIMPVLVTCFVLLIRDSYEKENQ